MPEVCDVETGKSTTSNVTDSTQIGEEQERLGKLMEERFTFTLRRKSIFDIKDLEQIKGSNGILNLVRIHD